MKFENPRFSSERLKLAQDNAIENNQSVIGFVEGYDPVTKRDRTEEVVVWDREVGGLSYTTDGAVAYCLPFRPEQENYIEDTDPFNRIDDTEKKKYE